MSDDQKVSNQVEPRWPPIVAVLTVLALLEFLPARLRVMPTWFPYVAAIVLLTPMVGVALTHSAVFVRVERIVTYVFAILAAFVTTLTLAHLVSAIVFRTVEIGGIPLLASAIGIWVVNIIAFTLLYWQIDRGGPDQRASRHEAPPDILFPEGPSETIRPFVFIDYFFFAHTTSTAFSPTETWPITARMKILMIVQSSLSLVTIVVIAARAINILK